MEKRNQDIREMRGNIPYWLIAERVGVGESTIYRYMRDESPEIREKLIKAIEAIKKELN